ncbi:ankyrin repeat-containing domain protein [Coniochaeta sp. 2T2.1]|nr:ankyrin repeat-containing domain protein [Coniochaeta sp. 2T2.1]
MVTAVHTGNGELVNLLIRYGANVNAPGYNGETPLHHAAHYGFTGITETLLDHGADINSRTSHGSTPLYAALSKDKPKVVELLLRRGADRHLVTNIKNWSPLEAASQFPDVLRLLASHTPALGLNRIVDPRDTTYSPGAALYHAVEGNHLESVKILLEGDSDLEYQLPEGCGENSGYTPLALAAREGRTEIVRLLLEKGANVNHMILGTLPILHMVKSEGVLAALLEYNINLELKDSNGDTVLNDRAVRTKSPGKMVVSPQFVTRLLDAGADMDTFNYFGDTAAVHATGSGNIEMLRLLLARKSDINGRGTREVRALYRAVSRGHLECLKLLIEHGETCITATAEPDLLTSTDNNGWTALHWALRAAYVLGPRSLNPWAASDSELTEVVRYLLDRDCPGLEMTVTTNGKQWTALSLARYHKMPQTAIDVLAEKSGFKKTETRPEAVRGKLWKCRADECDGCYGLCFRCIPHREAVHDPTHDEWEEEGEEFTSEVEDLGDDEPGESAVGKGTAGVYRSKL